MASCEFWHEPVREYFEKWTKEVSIAKYELIGIETYTDKDGNLCIASDQSVPVKLFLINPYHYTNVVIASDDIETTATGTFPTITQNADDSTLLDFTYGSDFLSSNECGGDIGATINVRHPMNGTAKEYTFSLKCNSKPPVIDDAAIMTTGSGADQKYVLAIRCPTTDKCDNNGIHRDIVSITINGVTYPVTPASNGELVFGDPLFTRDRPTSLTAINRNFDHSDLAVYFCPDEGASDETKNSKTYTITYTDRAGLTNTRTIDAKLPGMSNPLVYDNDNADSEAATLDESSVNILHIDSTENADYSTVTIKMPTVNDIGLSVSNKNPKIYWLLTDGSRINSDGNYNYSTDDVNLKIQNEGEYTLKVYAAADAHIPSSEKTYRLKLEYVQLEAPLVKDNDNNDLAYDGTVNHLHIDSTTDASCTTIKLTQAGTDSIGQTIYGGAISYTLLNGSNSEITISDSSEYASATQEADGSVTLIIKQDGDYTLRTHTTATGHRDSVTNEYKLKLEYIQLAPPVVTKTSGFQLTAGTGSNTNNYIEVGDTGKAKVKLCVPATDINGNNFLNAGEVKVYYNIDQGSTGTDPTNATSHTELEKTVDTLTPGQWVITAVAKKPGYKDSAVVTYKVKAFNCDIYVKSSDASDNSGNDSTGDGSQSNPYASISRAVQEIVKFNTKMDYKIYVLGEIKGTQSITSLTTSQAESVTIQGYDTGTLDGNNSGTTLSVNTSVPIFIKNLTIKGGSASGLVNQGNVTLKSGAVISGNSATSGGGISNSGTLTIESEVTISGNSATSGGGISNSGTLTIESEVTISGNSATNGGGISNSGSLTIESGATINQNSATYGGGIYINSTSGTLTIKGGEIKNNTVTNGGAGSAIYALKTFTVTQAAQINSSNDVYLANGIFINISGTLSNNNVANITPGLKSGDTSPWHRGTQVLSGTVPDSPATKFSVSQTGWSVIKYSSSSGILDAPLYVTANGNNNNSGASAADGYATIAAATSEISRINDSNRNYTINIVGTVKGAQTISGVDGKAEFIKLDGSSSGKLDAEGTSGTRPLEVSSQVPVIIENLTITGGNHTTGGGILLSSNTTVKLGNGAVVTGNTASNGGGGVRVQSGAKLFMYGSAVIGNNSKSTHADSGSGNHSNISSNNGGGIFNSGTVYIGYDAENSPKAITNNGGVWYNYAKYGGGIYNSGTVYLNTGNISYNGSSDDGGGIYNNNSSSAIIMTGGTLSGNSAVKGGAVHINSGTLTMTGGTIGGSGNSDKNTVSGSDAAGGAIYQNGTFKVSGSAYVYPGTVNSNDVYLPSSKYVTVDAAYSGSNQSATNQMAITPATWKRGTQVLDGSQAANYPTYFKGSEADWTTIKDTNDSNKVKLYTGYTIWVAGTSPATGVGTPKTSANGGRGTKSKPYSSISEAVEQCWTTDKDFIIKLSGTITGTSQTIPAANSTNKTGLAKSITLEGVTGNTSDVIDRNLSSATSGGSALTIKTVTPVTIKKIKITKGYTTSSGGGIYVSVGGASLTLGEGALITGNSASGNGGGIYFGGTSGSTANLIMNSTAAISGNSATGTSSQGGGVYLYYANLCMSGSSVIGDTGKSTYATSDGHSNQANTGGGIYCNSGSSVWIGYKSASATDTDPSYSNGVLYNYAGSGGGISAAAGNVYLAYGAISYNGTDYSTTGCNGGGALISYSASMTMSGGTIARNVANNGGGVYVLGSYAMTGGTIGDSGTKTAAADSLNNSSNYAEVNGGGLWLSPNTSENSVSLSGTALVKYNFASTHGGGIYVANKPGTVTIANEVSFNGAQYGGALYVYKSTPGPTLSTGANFNNNKASKSGGAIFIDTNRDLKITGGSYTSNIAGIAGGAIYQSGSLEISGGTFGESGKPNTCNASDNGGALHCANSNGFNIKGSASFYAGSAQSNNVFFYLGSVNITDAWTGSLTMQPYPYNDTTQYIKGAKLADHYASVSVVPEVVNDVTTKWITTKGGTLEKGIRGSATDIKSQIADLPSGSKIVVTGAITSDQVLDIGTEMTKRGVNDGSVGFSLDLSGTTGLTTIKAGAYNSGNSTGFYNCRSLTSLVLPLTVTTLEGSAFIGCWFLTSIIGLDNVTTLGSSCFWNCYRLTTFWELGPSEEPGTFNFAKTKVTGDLSAYSDVFQGAGIKEVIIPNTITKLGNNYFSGCTQLTEVTFESGSQLPEIPNSLFSGCTSLNSITNLPSTITRIGTNAFNNTAFTSFVVPNGVTEIGGSAFGSPKNLSYLVIPTSVTTIGSYLFFDSNHMIDVKYRGNETQWNNNITKADGWNKDRPSMGTNVVNSPITYNYTGD